MILESSSAAHVNQILLSVGLNTGEPISMVRFMNNTGLICWWNSSMTAILWLMKELGHKYIDLEDDEEDEPMTWFGHFIKWYQQCVSGTQAIVDPFPAINYFLEEYMGSSMEILQQQQYIELTLEALLGNPLDGNPGCPYFKFMQHSWTEETEPPLCTKCGHQEDKYSQAQALNWGFILQIPVSNDVTMKNCIEASFHEERQYECQKCHHLMTAQIRKTLDEPKQAIVFVLNRSFQIRKDCYKKDTRRVKLGGDITLPVRGGRQRYSLCSTMEHVGQSANSGHWRGHLTTQDGSFQQTSDTQIFRPSNIRDVESSTGFMYKIVQ